MEVNIIKFSKKILAKLKEKANKISYISGSYEELTSNIQKTIQDTLNKNQYSYIIGTLPDKAIIEIYTEDPVTYNGDFTYYTVPYTVEQDGSISLGDFIESEEIRNFEPVNKSVIFVNKDEAKRLITGPVAIPYYDDCDACRGEKQLTEEEIELMAHEYNTNFQISDEMHLIGAKGIDEGVIGKTVESWLLKEPLSVKNVKGDQVTLPVGTWMITVKISDDEVWKKIEDGTYQGFSATYVSKEDADNFQEQLKAASKRTLINDLEDPRVITVSVVDKPCVYDANFISVKTCNLDESSEKAGRRFSDAVFSKLKDVKDFIDGLISEAEAERTEPEESNKMEEIDMDKEELMELIEKGTEKAIAPLKEEIESLKGQLPDEAGKTDPEEDSEKKAPDGTEQESDKQEPEIPEEAQKKLDELEKENKALKKKLGIPVDKTSIEGQEGEDPATKTEPVSDRDAWGCKIRG